MGLNHLVPEDMRCPALHHALLEGMLLKVDEVLNNKKILYFLEGGSLLGCVREGRIIAHDDDIDLFCDNKGFEEASKALEQLCENFQIQVEDKEDVKTYQVKFHREKHWNYMFKIYIPNLWVQNTKSKKIFGTCTLDVFNYVKAGEKYKLKSLQQRKEFPNCYYLKNEIFPITRKKFGNIMANVPANPIPYLKRYYGANCLEEIKIDTRNALNPQEKTRNEELLNEN
jgi:phosphorylcholine metabolism protein LicD